MANLIFHRFAVAEQDAAILWYADRGPSVAGRFAAELERVYSAIAANPTRFGWRDDVCREALLARFPYVVIYRELGSDVWEIVAISHTSRDPDYWRSRVPDPGGAAP